MVKPYTACPRVGTFTPNSRPVRVLEAWSDDSSFILGTPLSLDVRFPSRNLVTKVPARCDRVLTRYATPLGLTNVTRSRRATQLAVKSLPPATQVVARLWACHSVLTALSPTAVEGRSDLHPTAHHAARSISKLHTCTGPPIGFLFMFWSQ